MADVFAKLIILGKRDFDEVPDDLKDAVRIVLIKRGYDEDGNKLPS
ncbi:hypothetical protein DesLBE_1947 [Desulfitobacterium sp. LBE]|uniref:Uncharacterized protein n=1 Tax=Desulfitobacterium hafniense TaxID=49338 RepID=A0A098B5I6_DESHA|nr:MULTISPECIES: CD1375 family protein [Desulfitobacterium]TWH57658.1 hypothetical protein DesLBE_1947 [Desulfitobacterium sp. LBE]CDX04143.1 Hypothetical protein DPCES_4257 [Desulfitobacterium hafniense]